MAGAGKPSFCPRKGGAGQCMVGRMGWLLLGVLLAAAGGALPAGAAARPGPSVVAVRSFVTEGYARLTLLLDRETLSFQHGRLSKPPRLFLDIPAGRLNPRAPLPADAAGARLVRGVRFGHPDRQTLRMVVDLGEGEIQARVFSLPDPHRIVVELRGGIAPSPPPSAGVLLPAPAPPVQGRAAPPSAEARAPLPPAPPKPPASRKRQEMSVAERFRAGTGRIVLDPGHGGKDPGTLGLYGLVEKDFVLDLAQRAARALRRALPGNEIFLTRTGDSYIPLDRRTAMANGRDADIFISIHANSSPLRGTSGIETYLLSEASSDRALEIAARENDVSLAEMSDLQKILYDLMLRSKVNESRELAEDVHRSLVGQVGRRYSGVNDLGVKRGPFYVLLGARMPSILIEVGFISNPNEARRSLQPAFRDALAQGIAEGVVRFVGGPVRRAGPRAGRPARAAASR